MHLVRPWLLICIAVFARNAFADGPTYQVDESKLPAWVKRMGDSPYKVIIESSVVHIKGASRAASAPSKKKSNPTSPLRTASAAAVESMSTPLSSVAGIAPPAGYHVALESRSSTRTASPTSPATQATVPIVIPSTAESEIVSMGRASTKSSTSASSLKAPTIGAVCPVQTAPTMPSAALEKGIGGIVKTRALVEGGAVKEVTIISGPAIFYSAVRSAMKTYRCQSSDTPISLDQEFVFEVN